MPAPFYPGTGPAAQAAGTAVAARASGTAPVGNGPVVHGGSAEASDRSVVVEELVFEVPPHELEAWLDADRAAWDELLASSPGFLGKEVWVGGPGDPVRVVVWWASDEHLERVPDGAQERADRRMGDLQREPRPHLLRRARVVPPRP